MNNRKRRYIIAVGISILTHALFLLLLYLINLQRDTEVRSREEVVLIDLGNVDEASGDEEPEGLKQEGNEVAEQPQPEPQVIERPSPQPKVQPKVPTPQPKQSTKPIASPTPAQPIQTQQHEESLRMQEEQKKQALKAAEARRVAEEEARRQAEAERLRKEQEEKKRLVGNSVAGAFGAGKGKNTSHGNGSGTGNQGNPSGAVGGSFSLSGRTIISNGGVPAMPRTNKAIEGKLVIAIEVNSAGVVTNASVRPAGSDIADPAVRAEAIRAAKQTKFNAQEGAGEQRGVIIYKYVLAH